MWAYNETFYQIYPIGFCGAPTQNDGVTEHRILKIGEWAGYLQELGVGSILFKPGIRVRQSWIRHKRFQEDRLPAWDQ